MRTMLLLPLVALGLSACSSEPAKEKSTDEVIAAVKDMAAPLPGLYSTKVELKEFSMPGLPPAQVEMMKKQFAANSGGTSTMCLTKAETENGYEDMLRKMGEGRDGVQCKFSRFDTSGSKVTAAMDCTGPGGMTMAIGMDGTVEPEHSDVTMTMKNSSSMAPGMEMSMVMQSVSTRVGDCPA